MNDLPITTRDKHICYGFTDGISLRNRQKVLLTLALGTGDQSANIKPIGGAQNWASNFDQAIVGKPLDDLDWRVFGSSQPFCEASSGGDFDFVYEFRYHFPKNPDLILIKTTDHQYIGRVPQRSQPALGRSSRNRFVKSLQKRT